MSTEIFWNVDTQYDFMRDDADHRGALAIPGAASIEPRLADLIQYARQRNIRIVHTRDSHEPGSPELSDTPDFQSTFPPHCMSGSRGEENIPAAEPQNALLIDWRAPSLDAAQLSGVQEIILTKDRFDCFTGSPHTEQLLHMLAPEHIVVFGVATNVCVNQAVLGMLQRGYRVTVVTDAIKELPGLPVDPVLEEWRRLGAKLAGVTAIVSI